VNKGILDIKSTLPSLDTVYSPLDFVGNTVGRYFDYKKETAMINHETQKIKSQTKIILKQIDAELQISLDSNDKNFKQEMFRLGVIAKELNESSKSKNEMFNHLSELTQKLGNPNIPMHIQEQIPQLIAMVHQQLIDERDVSMQKLNFMSEFNPNQKLIKGD